MRTSGKVRTLAVTSPTRVKELPEVPTLAEAGVRGCEVVTWSGIYVPVGTPQAIVKQLNAEINRIVQATETQERLASLGLVPVGGTPDALGEYLRAEIARWTKVVKAAGIKID